MKDKFLHIRISQEEKEELLKFFGSEEFERIRIEFDPR